MCVADVFGGDEWRNFVGCLRSVYINDVNILRRLHRQETVAAGGHDGSISGSGDPPADTRVVYAEVGSQQRRPNFGCHNVALSAVRFTRAGAFIRLRHQFVSDSFNFRMSFASVKPDGLLVSTRVVDDDLAQPSTHGLVHVSVGMSYFFDPTRPDPTRLNPNRSIQKVSIDDPTRRSPTRSYCSKCRKSFES